MSATAEHLLANRELLSLDRARLFLGSRQRVRTPLGAAEYLEMRKEPDGLWWKPEADDLIFEREGAITKRGSAYDERLKVALDCMEIYRTSFPREYAQSTAAPMSLQREQELYYLIHTQLFPLLRREDDLERVTGEQLKTFYESHPQFFLPYIPLRGAQSYFWQPGEFDFMELELEYQIALALSWQWLMPAGKAWELLKRNYRLECAAPLQATSSVSTGAVGWSLFNYSCRIEGKPLSWLPLAFNATAYKTGNMWLDIPPVGAVGVEWSLSEVFRLDLMYAQAADIQLALKAVGIWFEEKPQERIAHVVEIWNDAVRKEMQSGYAGTLRNEETGEWLQ